MKISILLLISTASSVPKIKAQVPYTPFPKGNISWQSWGKEYYGGPVYHFALSIDTASILIDNKVYNKIFINDTVSQKYIGGIREDDKKIYFYANSLNKEHLIYDFGLEIGDTLIVPFFINIRVEHFGHVDFMAICLEYYCRHLIYVAKAKDVITLENGEQRNTLIVDRYIHDFVYAPDTMFYFDTTQEWVEGLGLIGGQGFFTHLDFEDFFYTPVYLECICQNNSMLFGTNSKCCESNQITEKNQRQINLYPNPTTGELTIDNGQLIIESIEVFDVYGRNIGVKKLLPDENKIDISHLISGTYIVKITTEKGVFIEKFIKK